MTQLFHLPVPLFRPAFLAAKAQAEIKHCLLQKDSLGVGELPRCSARVMAGASAGLGRVLHLAPLILGRFMQSQHSNQHSLRSLSHIGCPGCESSWDGMSTSPTLAAAGLATHHAERTLHLLPTHSNRSTGCWLSTIMITHHCRFLMFSARSWRCRPPVDMDALSPKLSARKDLLGSWLHGQC